jgi:5-hydroxyisourate hydrolase-like protein (transthyretin family)
MNLRMKTRTMVTFGTPELEFAIGEYLRSQGARAVRCSFRLTPELGNGRVVEADVEVVDAEAPADAGSR